MIEGIVRERGPLTVAAFMDLALYHPAHGYYARAARRSGRAGDFFTSVDVGPLFGELLEIQIEEMARVVAAAERPLDLVEAGSGDGRLAADLLAAMRRRHPRLLERIRLWLTEASPAARAAQPATLRQSFDRPFTSSPDLPDAFEGILYANELLDAFPVHQVVMREEGLREIYVAAAPGPSGGLETCEGPPSTPALGAYLERLGVALEPGWHAEINLRAVEWMRDCARRLRRGFILLVDYGHAAPELYSASHSAGTLTTFARHTSPPAGASSRTPAWLSQPGDQDITAHVDFTSVQAAAEREGLTTLGFLDQTYFVLGLLPALESARTPAPAGAADRTTLQLKTLLMPGGLGSTMKVLILGKDVGRPSLLGCSYRVRVT